MKIKIQDRYYLRSTKYQFVLSKLVCIDEKGEAIFKDISYHPNLESALEAFGKHKLLASDAETFNALKNDIEAIKNTLNLIAESVKMEEGTK